MSAGVGYPAGPGSAQGVPPAPPNFSNVPNNRGNEFNSAVEGAVPDEGGPGTFPDFNNVSIQEILGQYAGQPLTPELLQQLAVDLSTLNLYGQFNQQQYQDNYLEYLESQLGFNQAQLDLAAQQLEFQSGPYWEWYTGPYFEFIQQDSDNKAAISESQAQSAEFGAKGSQYRSLSEFYGAQSAALNLQRRLAEDPREIRKSQFQFGVPVGAGSPQPAFGY